MGGLSGLSGLTRARTGGEAGVDRRGKAHRRRRSASKSRRPQCTAQTYSPAVGRRRPTSASSVAPAKASRASVDRQGAVAFTAASCPGRVRFRQGGAPPDEAVLVRSLSAAAGAAGGVEQPCGVLYAATSGDEVPAKVGAYCYRCGLADRSLLVATSKRSHINSLRESLLMHCSGFSRRNGPEPYNAVTSFCVVEWWAP